MYIPGRSRTGWRPFRIEMSLAPYATRGSFSECPLGTGVLTPSERAKVLVRGGVFGVPILPETRPLNVLSGRENDHLQRGDHAPSEGLVETLYKVLREVPNLGRPRGVVDLDDGLSVAH